MTDTLRRLSCVALCAALLPSVAAAQCMLANPSFEVVGTAPAVFAGWNQFGTVGSVSTAKHGALGARVSGPNTGGWDVSGYWQAQASTTGDRWKVTGYVRVPADKPLAGGSKAIVNVEWRNSGGGLISYESHDVATPASARDTFLAFSFTSAAAPTGTTSTRLVLGVLQGPGDPQRDAWYDGITFEKQTTPSLDALQWDDFSNGRTLSFSGRTWRVKNTGIYDPGSSWFSSANDAVWVDANGRLHLTIKKVGATWYSTEVALDTALGYGDYLFTTRGDLDTFHPTTVFGLFVWEYGPCWDTGYLWWNPYNEIDVEFSRWGIAGGPNAQFVVQPYDWGGNRSQFTMNFSTDEVTTHAFRWRPDRVECRSWRGGPNDELPANTVRAWTYTGPHIPRPDQPRVHLNLWQFAGAPTTTQEAVLDAFTFRAWPSAFLGADEGATQPAQLALAIAGRNPSRGGATLRCALPSAARVRVSVHDVAGRLVRELVNEPLRAGTHEFAWDGRALDGERVAPGVYLARLQAGERVATARLVVLR